MTVSIPFLPSVGSSPPFQTTIMMDGAQYGLSAMWNFYRQDWYFTLTDAGGNIVLMRPLIGSPVGSPINLTFNLFTTSTLAYYPSTGNFVQTP
jgi:hypothetical protein